MIDAVKSKPLHKVRGIGQGGQILVEYVLLLVVGVGLAALITTTMVSRSPNNPGFLVKKWFEIVKAIGADTPDDLAPQK